jgi:hypothetical protein
MDPHSHKDIYTILQIREKIHCEKESQEMSKIPTDTTRFLEMSWPTLPVILWSTTDQIQQNIQITSVIIHNNKYS